MTYSSFKHIKHVGRLSRIENDATICMEPFYRIPNPVNVQQYWENMQWVGRGRLITTESDAWEKVNNLIETINQTNDDVINSLFDT